MSLEHKPESRLKGTLVSKWEAKEAGLTELGHFSQAIQLHVMHDEDGPPIAKNLIAPSLIESALKGTLAGKNRDSKGAEITVLSVADGLGGSGARGTHRKDNPDVTYSHAFVGARAAQQAIERLILENPRAFQGSAGQIGTALEAYLSQEFVNLPKIYETPPSLLKSKLSKDFPTTLATAVVQDKEQERVINLFWQGDSPFFIITPGQIFMTAQEGDGDAPMKVVIDLDGQKLQTASVVLNKEVPVIVVAATDALLKLGRDSTGEAIRFILQCLKKAKTVEEVAIIFKTEYAKALDNGAEGDDATISLAAFLPAGSSIGDFDGFKTPKIIEATG